MTREEKLAALYQGSTVYRPLGEEDSILAEIAVGCSWRKCAFCDFTRDPFGLIPLETVRKNIQTMGELGVNGTRVFLLGQNAFCRGADELMQIFGYLRHYLPQINEISMYARADDILRKTPEQLQTLRELGLTDLHIGVESGSDTVLAMAEKGGDGFRSAKRLSDAGPGGNRVSGHLHSGLGRQAFVEKPRH